MQSSQILIAEDDAFSQMAVKMIVTSLKREPIIAPDGEAALKVYKDRQGGFSFILMDLHMPKLDGFEAAKRIREAEKLFGLNPIKMFGLSADHDDFTKKKCLDSGMNGLIAKPLKKDVLSQLL